MQSSYDTIRADVDKITKLIPSDFHQPIAPPHGNLFSLKCTKCGSDEHTLVVNKTGAAPLGVHDAKTPSSDATTDKQSVTIPQMAHSVTNSIWLKCSKCGNKNDHVIIDEFVS